MSNPTIMRFAHVAIFVFAGVVRLLAAAPKDAGVANDIPVFLPPFVVETERTDFNNWSKTVSAHYIIYTDQGIDQAKTLIQSLEKLRVASARLLGRELLRTDRMIFVLPDSHSDWARLEHLGKEEWKPAAQGLTYTPVRLCLVKTLSGLGQFLTHSDEGYYFYSMLGISLGRNSGLPSLLWFDRGLGNLVGNSIVEDNSVKLGRSSIKERVPLRSKGFIPWNRFFAINTNSPEYLKSGEIKRYDAQCSVFMRYLLTDDDPNSREKLLHWVNYLGTGRTASEEAFKATFGQDWAQWQLMMDVYMKKRERHVQTFTFKQGEVDTQSKTVDLKAVEMRELFLIAQLLSQKKEEMLPLLEHMLKKGLRSECLRPLLVSACIRNSKNLDALEQLRCLMKTGTDNPQVYEEAARILLKLRVGALDLESRLGPQDMEIRIWAQKALDLEPCSLLASQVLAFSYALEYPLAPASVQLISEHLRKVGEHPARLELMTSLALAQARQGNHSEAHELCEKILEELGDSYPQASFIRQLKAQLENQN
jgi:hypothetical protein